MLSARSFWQLARFGDFRGIPDSGSALFLIPFLGVVQEFDNGICSGVIATGAYRIVVVHSRIPSGRIEFDDGGLTCDWKTTNPISGIPMQSRSKRLSRAPRSYFGELQCAFGARNRNGGGDGEAWLAAFSMRVEPTANVDGTSTPCHRSASRCVDVLASKCRRARCSQFGEDLRGRRSLFCRKCTAESERKGSDGAGPSDSMDKDSYGLSFRGCCIFGRCG